MSEKTAPTFSPYEAAKKVNAFLKEQGIEKVLPPQMFYTYTAKGYIESVVVGGKRRVTDDALATWTTKYVAKNFSKSE